MVNPQRISYIDARIGEANLRSRDNTIPKLLDEIAVEPNKLPQRRRFLLVDEYAFVGFMSYGLGAELPCCRNTFIKALRINIEAFRLRGTQDAFPLTDMFVDPSKLKGDSARVRLQDRHASGTKEFSATNSSGAYFYVCLGLGVGEDHLAKEQASLMWGSPGADYIGPKSQVCTPNQQALAFALRDLLNGDREAALANILRVRTLPKDYVGKQTHLLKSLIQRDADAFLRNLNDLLEKHEYLSTREKWNPLFYICVPALGMSALAVKTGLIKEDHFPANIYLPVALFAKENSPGQPRGGNPV